MPMVGRQAPGSMWVTNKDGMREERRAAVVMIFTCEVCGEPASCLVDANIRETLRNKKFTGRAYCGPHAPADYWPNGVSPYGQTSL